MKRRILLVNPNTYDNPYPVFPLGLAYVESSLKSIGVETYLYDFCLEEAEGLPKKILEWKPELIGISLRNVDDVRISVREFFVDGIRDLIAEIKTYCDVPIVLGGSGFSVFPEEIFEYCVPDIGQIGEGEASFVALAKGEPLESIPGIIYSENGQTKKNAVVLDEQCDFGAPYREKRILDFYLQDGGMANVQTQRGCPLQCCYCTYPLIEGKRYRRRSGHSIADEFVALKEAGAKYVFIVDSVFNTSEQHVKNVCEALIDRGSPLPWGCFMRPKCLNDELAEMLKKSGLAHVEFGSDSLSDTTLKSYGKGFTFADLKAGSDLMVRHGIDYCHFLIFGGPGETESTLEESFYNSQQLSSALIFPSIGMRVYPGTSLHRVGSNLDPMIPESGAQLLKPTYFLAEGLSETYLEEKIASFALKSSNWVDLDSNPEFEAIAKRLRKKGVAGPLWNYLSVLRRIS